MVIHANDPRTPVIEKAPLLCIEIVSPDDSLRDLTERAREYLTAGVPQTWIFDPVEKRAYFYSTAGLHEAQPNSILRSGAIEISLTVLHDIAT